MLGLNEVNVFLIAPVECIPGFFHDFLVMEVGCMVSVPLHPPPESIRLHCPWVGWSHQEEKGEQECLSVCYVHAKMCVGLQGRGETVP